MGGQYGAGSRIIPAPPARLVVSKDPLQLLLEHLRTEEGAPVPTSLLGRLRRTAVAGARVGLGALAGRLRGRDLNLGALSPEALARLVESFGELKGVAMKVGQILSYVDGCSRPVGTPSPPTERWRWGRRSSSSGR
jgi:hypothetical protein